MEQIQGCANNTTLLFYMNMQEWADSRIVNTTIPSGLDIVVKKATPLDLVTDDGIPLSVMDDIIKSEANPETKSVAENVRAEYALYKIIVPRILISPRYSDIATLLTSEDYKFIYFKSIGRDTPEMAHLKSSSEQS